MSAACSSRRPFWSTGSFRQGMQTWIEGPRSKMAKDYEVPLRSHACPPPASSFRGDSTWLKVHPLRVLMDRAKPLVETCIGDGRPAMSPSVVAVGPILRCRAPLLRPTSLPLHSLDASNGSSEASRISDENNASKRGPRPTERRRSGHRHFCGVASPVRTADRYRILARARSAQSASAAGADTNRRHRAGSGGRKT